MNKNINAREILLSGNSLFVIASARGAGKTTAAATLLKSTEYDKLYVHDDERSWNNIETQLKQIDVKIGHYVDLAGRFADLPDDDDMLSQIADGRMPWVDQKTRTGLIEYYNFIINDLDKNMTPGKYDVYVLDTLKRLEASMAVWAQKNMGKLGVTNTSHGRDWSEGIFPLYEGLISSIFARGIKVIIFTSHLKQPWENNKPVPGKVVLSGKKILQFLSRFMVWLIKDNRNTSGAPAALVLKERLGRIGITESGEWDIRRVIPERIPSFTWTEVERYIREGYNAKNPDPREIMSPEEIELVSDAMTDKQMQLMVAEAQKEAKEAEIRLKQESAPLLSVAQTIDTEAPLAKKIAEIIESGTTDVSTIRQSLNGLFEGVTVPQIIKIVKALQLKSQST